MRFILSRPKTNKWRTQLKTLLPHLILQQLLIPHILLPLLVQPRLLKMYEGSSIVRTSKRMLEKPTSTLYVNIQMHSFHPSPLLQRMTSKSYLHRLHINRLLTLKHPDRNKRSRWLNLKGFSMELPCSLPLLLPSQYYMS
ncbi:hypothetical protein SELMODRAFT_431809 [Selaginella moellendorffii]|uniref:Uncharacterized protein n=1 Tax=Selaginella moellendorffii TaxID=88036 RepID=D8TDV8_SELML|nr:hypothetical protein SELMODRAFT_431809 [Selaginella moellendorffii]